MAASKNNEQQQLSRVLPILLQELINDFADIDTISLNEYC